MQYRLTLKALAVIALLGLCVSCGEDSSKKGVSYEVVSGTVELPDGITAAEVVNPRGASEVGPDGSFELETTAGTRQLAVVLSPTGDPLLMGWFGKDAPTLTTRTTAEVLTFFGANAFLAPHGLQPDVQRSLGEMDDLDDVATALETVLGENPDGVTEEHPDLQAAVSEASLALYEHGSLGGTGATSQALIVVNPAKPKSGIDVNTVAGLDDVVLANSYRRAAYAFVDQVAVTVDGERKEKPAEIKRMDVPSVQGLQGGVGTVAQILAGTVEPGGLEKSENIAYVPRSTKPVRLANADGAEKTEYRIAVVGPGHVLGELDKLTEEERKKQIEITRVFVVKELLLPLILQMLVPASDLDLYLNAELAGSVVGDFIAIVTTQAPKIWDLAEEGDIVGAFAEGHAAIMGSGTFRDALLDTVLEWFFDLSTAAGDKAYSRASKAAARFAAVSGGVDLVTAAFDASAVGNSIANANMADIWLVDAIASKVNLEPGFSKVEPGKAVTLTTYVPAAGDDVTFEYRYSTSGKFGTLNSKSTNKTGDMIQSSAETIDYVADDDDTTGTDTVTVEVFEVKNNQRMSVGSATASVEVTEGCNVESAPVDARIVRTANETDDPQKPTIGKSIGVIFVWEPVEGAKRYQIKLTGASVFNLEADKILSEFQPTGQRSKYFEEVDDHPELAQSAQMTVNAGELFYYGGGFGQNVSRDEQSLTEWEQTVIEYYAQLNGVSVKMKPLCD